MDQVPACVESGSIAGVARAVLFAHLAHVDWTGLDGGSYQVVAGKDRRTGIGRHPRIDTHAEAS